MTAARQDLGDVLRDPRAAGGLRTAFQPIVDLNTEAVVGFEALTRGPSGTPLESPLELFAAAREGGRVAELDRMCRDIALERAVDLGVLPPLSVFVNVEPDLVSAEPTEDDATWREAPTSLRCVIELTERALTDRPADLLAATAGIRELSWGLALDDVGADNRSLALMSLLRPDVVKLDLRLVQRRTDRDQAGVLSAVNAYAEETGAVVLAEGIETEEHLHTALGMGAQLGQGWFFGRPEERPEPPGQTSSAVRFLGHELDPSGPTPFDVVRAERPVRRADRAFVSALMEQLEHQALAHGETVTVLWARSADEIDAASTERMRTIADAAALSGVVGVAAGAVEALRTAGLEDSDPLARETDLVVLAPHFASAVVSRRIGEATGDADDLFELGVTHDRDLVTRCARALAGRLLPV